MIDIGTKEKSIALLNEILLLEQSKKEIADDITDIKKDLCECLKVKSNVINKLVQFFKIKSNKDVDELDEISTLWLELFN